MASLVKNIKNKEKILIMKFFRRQNGCPLVLILANAIQQNIVKRIHHD
jgi:hypothetical protein